ncbi:DUF550 domain-containing protein [Salmonella enterica subsp. enterica serovar Hvittingfoss]|nr:DUF550 domain-containing protein [Salmonella enterica subsp. enterica serovar Hvittingfoss]
MTTITKEWLQQTIAEFENTRDDIPFGLSDDDAKILIVLKRALASLEREQVRHEHADWSDATFGDAGPIGPLKHLSKEALEAAADPSDPLEWADMQFLLWDAQRRMGISDEFITRAMIEKLEINKSRQWPEPKDGEPRLHIKEQPVPVVPDYASFEEFWSSFEHPFAEDDELKSFAVEIWNACRTALLHGAEPVSQTYELPQTQFEQVADLYEMQFDDGRTCAFHTDGAKAAQWLLACDGNKVQEYVRLERYHEALIGNSPVIPDGWISCSERMPDREYVLAGDFSGTHYLASIPNVQVGIYADWFDDEKPCWDDGDGNDLHLKQVTHWMPLPEPPKQE